MPGFFQGISVYFCCFYSRYISGAFWIFGYLYLWQRRCAALFYDRRLLFVTWRSCGCCEEDPETCAKDFILCHFILCAVCDFWDRTWNHEWHGGVLNALNTIFPLNWKPWACFVAFSTPFFGLPAWYLWAMVYCYLVMWVINRFQLYRIAYCLIPMYGSFVPRAFGARKETENSSDNWSPIHWLFLKMMV